MDLTINVLTYNSGVIEALTVDAAGIDIGGDSNGGASDNHTATLTDGSSVDISISQTGYLSYSKTISNVYSEDKTINIILPPEVTDIEDADYRRPHPMFFSFNDPCSFNVDVYNASSSSANVSYYVNNVLFSDATDVTLQFCEPGSYQVKQRMVVSEIVNNNGCPQENIIWDRQWANSSPGETGNTVSGTVAELSTYLDDDTETNTTILEYRPTFTLTSSSSTNQLDEACCYTKEEEITVSSNVTITREGSTASDYVLSYTVTDPNGTTVILEEDTFNLSDSNTDISFTVTELGTYTVEVTLTDTVCNLEYTRTLEFDTCNFITISSVSCNTFRLDNKSSSIDVEFYIDNINGTQEVGTTTLEAGSSYLINLNSTSLFTINTTYTLEEEEVTEIFVINNFCNIEDCLSGFILDIICEEDERCSECPDDIELNRFLLLYNTYFMKLNIEYGWNNFYSVLTDAKLAELTSIQQVMDKLIAYCERRGCLLQGFEGTENGNVTLQACTNTIYKQTTKTDSGCKTCG